MGFFYSIFMHVYYPILIVLFFPIVYKVSYWIEFFSQCDGESRHGLVRRICSASYSFWLVSDIVLFLWAFAVFWNPLYEYFIYNFFFYNFLLYNVFVFWKIFRRKWNIKIGPMQLLSFCLLIIFLWMWYFYTERFLYPLIYIYFMLQILIILSYEKLRSYYLRTLIWKRDIS